MTIEGINSADLAGHAAKGHHMPHVIAGADIADYLQKGGSPEVASEMFRELCLVCDVILTFGRLEPCYTAKTAPSYSRSKTFCVTIGKEQKPQTVRLWWRAGTPSVFVTRG